MKMKIDVSEMKSFRSCKRQWLFSSRNHYKISPIAPSKAISIGKLFHEALAQLYLGANYEKVIKLVESEITKDQICVINMLKYYYSEVLLDDLAKWTILDVEWVFTLPWPGIDDLELTGAVDLLVLEWPEEDGHPILYGVEHKTCSSFRDTTFTWMDEQPRVYTHAIEDYLERAIKDGRLPPDTIFGGIYINEVKKLLRDFQYKRFLCEYSMLDQELFWEHFNKDALECKNATRFDPTPHWMNCNQCQFKTVCAEYKYVNPTKEEFLRDHGHEFHERAIDHLDEPKLLKGDVK